MNTHYDFKNTRATVTFNSSQDADDLIRDIQGCTVRSGHGHFCNVESITIVETRRIKLSVQPVKVQEVA